MTIVHCPGKEMILKDCIFRKKKAKESTYLDIKVDLVQFSVQRLVQIQEVTNADLTLHELRDMILLGYPNAFKEVGQNILPYWLFFQWLLITYCDELAIENGILLKGVWILIPKSM